MAAPYLPLPGCRVALGFTGTYDADEFKRIVAGYKSADMDQKWDIVFDSPWLAFHRSWTGIANYGVRFESGGEQAVVTDSWINSECFACDEEALRYHRRLLGFLIDVFLLRKPSEFPFPPGLELKGLQVPAYVHMVQGYPPDDSNAVDD
ncbi:MAG TPA: hypothetical protein VER77_06885 [Candidatus Dormibacteraeota bacterium]|nr:hypothetical protein [Candidatus Dormibacteraeota bacterium]